MIEWSLCLLGMGKRCGQLHVLSMGLLQSAVSAEKAKEVKEQSKVDFKALLSPDIPEEEVEQELSDLMSRLAL